MRVLAIGATGFIGPHVVRRLVEHGHDVAVLRRGETTACLSDGVRHLYGNRDSVEDYRSEFERFGPDVVLDLILYTEGQARQTVETFRGTAGRIVAASSADVYRNYDGLRGRGTAPPDPAPLTEDAPLRASRYPYRGATIDFEHAHDYEKILVEQVLLSEPKLPATVLRLPAVYGPGDGQHRLRPYLRYMDEGATSIHLGEGQAGWRWTRGFVENVAAALALAVTKGRSAGRIYNVGDEPTLTEREWVERIGLVAGWGGGVVPIPATDADHFRSRSDWRYDLWTDTGRIRDELGYVEEYSLGDALERTVEWERSQ